MKIFTKLTAVLSIIYVAVTTATELTTAEVAIKDEQKNWYQVDVIVFNYNDFPLDSITPRILPLEKKFIGNKIIPLESPEHPLNSSKNETVTVSDSLDFNLSSENKYSLAEEASTTVSIYDEPINLNANYQTTKNKTEDARLSRGNAQLVETEISITSEFLEKVKLPNETSKNTSVSDNSIVKNDNRLINKDDITSVEISKQLKDDNHFVKPLDSLEKAVVNNEHEEKLAYVKPALSELNYSDIQSANNQAEQIQNDIINQQVNFSLNTTSFVELPSSKYLLQDKFDALTAEDNIQVLSYNCFNLQIEDSSLVVLEPKESDNFKVFSGKISFKRSKQKKIVIKTDFYLNMSVDELQKIKKQQNQLAEYSNKINKKVYNYISYETQNSIKDSGKLLYIDSSIVGLLIKITPININLEASPFRAE